MRKKITILTICLLSLALLAAGCSSAVRNTANSTAPERGGQFLAGGAPPVLASDVRTSSFQGYTVTNHAAMNWDLDAEIIPGLTTRDAISSQVQLGGISYTASIEPISAESARMIIRDASVGVETRDFESFFVGVQALARELGGYVQNSSINDHGWSRSANLVLRVPAEALDDFLDTLNDEYTRVSSQNTWQRDVTMQHNDMTAQLEALRVEEEALLRLLAQSGNLSDLLAVQNQLTHVRHQLNRLEGEVRLLENQVALSTVDLHIWEVERLPLEEDAGFWARIGDGFVRSLRNLGASVANFFASLIIFLPYIILIAAIAIIVLVIMRRRVRKCRSKRKEKREAQGE